MLILAMLIGTIDVYHFIPLSVTLALAEGYKGSAKQPLGFIFLHAFQLVWMKFDIVLKHFKSNILIVLLSDI